MDGTKRAWAACVLLGLCIGICIKLFVADILRVKGTSMEPAFRDGSLAVMNKLAYGLVRPFGDSLLMRWGTPRAGDVVIYPYEGRLVIKRCAATGGTPLDYSLDSGYTLHVGASAYPLTAEQYHLMNASHSVPEGFILAIGDNYAASIDSRNYGFVAADNVLGRVREK